MEKEISSDKNWKEVFVNLLFDMFIYLTNMKLSLHYALWKPPRGWICEGIFGSMLMPMVKRVIASDKTWKEAF